jgi:ABC-type antimicrobial peptide transport system permease subunit
MASGRLVQTQLFGLSAYDPLSLGSALATMVLVAVIAAFIPALRATKIDPVVALHYE